MALTADQLSQIDQPSLLIFAANDPFGAADVGGRVAQALPNAQLHVVEGGQAPGLRHVDQIAPLVAGFLADHDHIRTPDRR